MFLDFIVLATNNSDILSDANKIGGWTSLRPGNDKSRTMICQKKMIPYMK